MHLLGRHLRVLNLLDVVLVVLTIFFLPDASHDLECILERVLIICDDLNLDVFIRCVDLKDALGQLLVGIDFLSARDEVSLEELGCGFRLSLWLHRVRVPQRLTKVDQIPALGPIERSQPLVLV